VGLLTEVVLVRVGVVTMPGTVDTDLVVVSAGVVISAGAVKEGVGVKEDIVLASVAGFAPGTGFICVETVLFVSTASGRG